MFTNIKNLCLIYKQNKIPIQDGVPIAPKKKMIAYQYKMNKIIIRIALNNPIIIYKNHQ